jgi:hypothetical protein
MRCAREDRWLVPRLIGRLSGSPRSCTAGRVGTRGPCTYILVQCAAHSSISPRRFSNRSPRLYAASTRSATVCANAASATSRAYPVDSAAQSRNALRKPCGTMGWPFASHHCGGVPSDVAFIRRTNITIAMLLNGFFGRVLGNTKAVRAVSNRSLAAVAKTASASEDNGTRCSLERLSKPSIQSLYTKSR